MNLPARVWMGAVIAPTALGMGYGFLIDKAYTRSPLFETLMGIMPLWCWGVLWVLVGVLAAGAAVFNYPFAARMSSIVGAPLAFALAMSTYWARYANNVRVSWVGLSWAYFLFVSIGFAALYPWLLEKGRRP